MKESKLITGMSALNIALIASMLVLTGCSVDKASNPTVEKSGEIMAEKDIEAMTEPEVFAQTDTFKYAEYTDEAFNDMKGKQAFSVFVSKKTCGGCAKLSSEIEANAADLDGSILKMEFAEMPPAFAKAYGVKTYHTLVSFDENGDSTNTIAGATINDVKSAGNTEDMMKEKAPSANAGNDSFVYAEYTEEKFNEIRGSVPFAVFVASKNCGTCAKKEAQIKAEMDQFKKGMILRMEYDQVPGDFKKQYGINHWDTFVIFDMGGNPTVKGGATVSEVRNALQS